MSGAFAGLALAGASIVVLPGVGDTIREPKWIWLWVVGLMGLARMIWRRKWPQPLPPALWVFLAYLFIQPYLFASPLRVWPFTASLLAVLVLAMNPFQEDKNFDRFLLGATWLQLLLGGLQIIGLDPIFSKYTHLGNTHPLVGFLGQETIFGAWMAPLAWFWFGKKRWVEFAVCSVAVFVTASAFSVFGWAFGLAAWLLWRYSKRALIFLTVAFFSALTLVFSLGYGQGFFHDNGRYLAWRMILNAWRYEPWFGYGVDSFSREFRFHQGFGGVPWAQAHNEFLELLFGGGLVGLALGLSALSLIWLRRKNWWGRRECLPWFLALTAILANSLGNFPLHIAPIALLAVTAYFRLLNRVAV